MEGNRFDPSQHQLDLVNHYYTVGGGGQIEVYPKKRAAGNPLFKLVDRVVSAVTTRETSFATLEVLFNQTTVTYQQHLWQVMSNYPKDLDLLRRLKGNALQIQAAGRALQPDDKVAFARLVDMISETIRDLSPTPKAPAPAEPLSAPRVQMTAFQATAIRFLNRGELAKLIDVLKEVGMAEGELSQVEENLQELIGQQAKVIRFDLAEIRKLALGKKEDTQAILLFLTQKLKSGEYTAASVLHTDLYAAFALTASPAEKKHFQQRRAEALVHAELRQRLSGNANPFPEEEQLALELLGIKLDIDDFTMRQATNQAMVAFLQDQLRAELTHTDFQKAKAHLAADVQAVRLESAGLPRDQHEALLKVISIIRQLRKKEIAAATGIAQQLPGFGPNHHANFPILAAHLTDYCREILIEARCAFTCLREDLDRGALIAAMQTGNTEAARQLMIAASKSALGVAKQVTRSTVEEMVTERLVLYRLIGGQNLVKEFFQGGDEAFRRGVCLGMASRLVYFQLQNPDAKAEELPFEIDASVRHQHARNGVGISTARGGYRPTIDKQAHFALSKAEKATISSQVLLDTDITIETLSELSNLLRQSLEGLQVSNGTALITFQMEEGAHAIAIRLDTVRDIFRIQEPNGFSVEFRTPMEPGEKPEDYTERGLIWALDVLTQTFKTLYPTLRSVYVIQGWLK